ncbi:MAG: hypothetical protein K2X27_06050 [Candidatus Obscuribacterales bacterium]|nr:hypothetical protein [Candidatus Obscuribacterales bacterium]
MGFNEVPNETAKQSDSVQSKDADLNRFLEELMTPAKTPGKGPNASIGQVESMTLPDGWQAGPVEKPYGGASFYQEYNPQGNSDTKITFFYRGKRISEDGGKNFHEILQKPAHVLSPQEFNSLAEVLRDKAKAQDFDTVMAKTEDLNGKRVLIVEGRYKDLQEDNRSVLIDADGSGTAVQEIYYQAPKAQFIRNYKQAILSMKSINWK